MFARHLSHLEHIKIWNSIKISFPSSKISLTLVTPSFAVGLVTSVSFVPMYHFCYHYLWLLYFFVVSDFLLQDTYSRKVYTVPWIEYIVENKERRDNTVVEEVLYLSVCVLSSQELLGVLALGLNLQGSLGCFSQTKCGMCELALNTHLPNTLYWHRNTAFFSPSSQTFWKCLLKAMFSGTTSFMSLKLTAYAYQVYNAPMDSSLSHHCVLNITVVLQCWNTLTKFYIILLQIFRWNALPGTGAPC